MSQLAVHDSLTLFLLTVRSKVRWSFDSIITSRGAEALVRGAYILRRESAIIAIEEQ